MVIKMSGDNIAVHIVGRVLDRSKLLNVPADRKNNDSSGVLARGPAHSGAALDDPVDLTVPLSLSPLFVIIFYIAESRLLRQSTDGPGLKGLSSTEDNLYIPVGFSLIIPGEVQVNIRLFVSLKSQESFEGDIKAFFLQRLSAHRAVLIRHVTACPS